MRLTLNDIVRVRLTDYGRKILRENHEELKASLPKLAYHPPKEDADGCSKWQLWCLIKEFGPHMHWGGELPFEIEIDLPEPERDTTTETVGATYIPSKGVSIMDAITGALDEAKLRDCAVRLVFNDWETIVKPTDRRGVIAARWQGFQAGKETRRHG